MQDAIRELTELLQHLERSADTGTADEPKEISRAEFYGERRGSFLSDEGMDARESAVALIDANDLPAFESSLERIGQFTCGYEIVDDIFQHLLLPAALDNREAVPDLSHTEGFFECLIVEGGALPPPRKRRLRIA